MEINVSVYCGLEPGGISQCGLLLDALESYRDEVNGGHIYDDTATALQLLNDLTEQVGRGMLHQIERLDSVQVIDRLSDTGYREVYVPTESGLSGRLVVLPTQPTVEGDRAE